LVSGFRFSKNCAREAFVFVYGFQGPISCGVVGTPLVQGQRGRKSGGVLGPGGEGLGGALGRFVFPRRGQGNEGPMVEVGDTLPAAGRSMTLGVKPKKTAGRAMLSKRPCGGARKTNLCLDGPPEGRDLKPGGADFAGFFVPRRDFRPRRPHLLPLLEKKHNSRLSRGKTRELEFWPRISLGKNHWGGPSLKGGHDWGPGLGKLLR